MKHYLFIAMVVVGLIYASCASRQSERILVREYCSMQSALVQDDVHKAQTAAKKISLKSKDTQLTVAAERVVSASNVVQARMAFAELSKRMISLAESGQINAKGLKRVYCPGFYNNEGVFWLQPENEAVSNPYYGARMVNGTTVQQTY